MCCLYLNSFTIICDFLCSGEGLNCDLRKNVSRDIA